MLNIHRERRSDIELCCPAGELEAFTVNLLREALAEMASSPRVVIDLSGVTFVDSAGLGALIGGIRRVREQGGDVAVACGRPVLIRLLHSTGFDRIVYVAATVPEAIEALTSTARNPVHAASPSPW